MAGFLDFLSTKRQGVERTNNLLRNISAGGESPSPENLGALIDSGLIGATPYNPPATNPLEESGLLTSTLGQLRTLGVIPTPQTSAGTSPASSEELTNFIKSMRRQQTTPSEFSGVNGALNRVLENEGGYTNNPADRGGATNRGITKPAYAEYFGIDPSKVTNQMIRSLDFNTARAIYRKNFVEEPGFHTLSFAPNIQQLVIDTAAHTGPARSTRFIQRALRTLGFSDVNVDSHLGPDTIEALQRAVRKYGEAKVNNTILANRSNALQAQAQGDASQRQFQDGWRNRLREFRMNEQGNPSNSETK